MRCLTGPAAELRAGGSVPRPVSSSREFGRRRRPTSASAAGPVRPAAQRPAELLCRPISQCPFVKPLLVAAILLFFRGLVKVLQRSRLPTNTGQPNPVRVADDPDSLQTYRQGYGFLYPLD